MVSGLLECCNFTPARRAGPALCDSLHNAGRGLQKRAQDVHAAVARG
jgi:hypothetical protein